MNRRWHGVLLTEFEALLKNLIFFFDRNEHFKETLFILVYAVEQLLILLFLPTLGSSSETFVGVAVLVVLTTITLDKLLLKRELGRKNEELINTKYRLELDRKAIELQLEMVGHEYNSVLDLAAKGGKDE